MHYILFFFFTFQKNQLNFDLPCEVDAKTNIYVKSDQKLPIKNPYENICHVIGGENHGFERDSQTDISSRDPSVTDVIPPPGNEDMSRNGCFKTKYLKYLIVILMGVLLTTTTSLSIIFVSNGKCLFFVFVSLVFFVLFCLAFLDGSFCFFLSEVEDGIVVITI